MSNFCPTDCELDCYHLCIEVGELGWESLHNRRYFRRITQFYKIMNGLTPQYLRDYVPNPRLHLYGTNPTNDLYPIFCRSERFQNSFYPDAVKCWNNIGP